MLNYSTITDNSGAESSRPYDTTIPKNTTRTTWVLGGLVVITTYVFGILVIPSTGIIPLKGEDFCGYQTCPKADPNALNVHIIAHSHNDVGWLKTVDQLYYGSNTAFQRAGVQYILDSVVDALLLKPERRYIQVETLFFYKWWSYQTKERRDIVLKLVKNGQFEIVGGGWSMNDEGAAHYQSIIDQFTLGFSVLYSVLGKCGRPKIGWQIDPFGHSREQASIFAQLGLDAVFLNRIDYRDKDIRLATRTPEMIWRGSPSLGNTSDIFTSIMYNDYSAPNGLCFDVLCDDDPVIDDKDSPEYNYEQKVNVLAAHVKSGAAHYKTNNLLVTFGDDFNYQDALSNFINLDLLIKGFDLFNQTYEGKPIKVFYSTPSCYVKAVNDESRAKNIDFPLKTDDFFPFATDKDAYFTGYFTSRPTSKRMERVGNNLLQVSRQLAVFTKGTDEYVRDLREAMGIMQHHDAITGTERQHVANDYHRIMDKAIKEAYTFAGQATAHILNPGAKNLTIFDSCILSNISYCPASSGERFNVVVYNPLSRVVSHHVRIPVQNSYAVSYNGQEITSQILPSITNFSYTPFETAPYDLVFLAENIPPLGLKVYTFNTPREVKIENDKSDGYFKLGDDKVGVEVDANTGKLKSISINGIKIDVEQEFMYYPNYYSNAYLFRPIAAAVPNMGSVSILTYKGAVVDEIHQTIGNWTKQIIRVYKNEPYIEFDWIVGPIDMEEYIGKDVISRFKTKLATKDVFYTDANGREMLKRIRNYRPTYNFTSESPITANYYPVPTKIVLKDEEQNLQFAVLTDRAEGGASLENGEVELMVHRRLLQPDFEEESLSEYEFSKTLVARGTHYVTLGHIRSEIKTASAVERDIASRKLLEPWIFFTTQNSALHTFSGLTKSLPENVKILTLEVWEPDGANAYSILLRFEHVLEYDDDPRLSKTANVNLENLFTTFDVCSIKELALGADRYLDEVKKLKWNVGEILRNPDEHGSPTILEENIKEPEVCLDPLTIITLQPMQIRTFVANIIYKTS